MKMAAFAHKISDALHALTLIHICTDPGKLYQVPLQPFSEPQNQQRSHALHTFQTTVLCFFGVRADPAATKLVSFFVNVYEG